MTKTNLDPVIDELVEKVKTSSNQIGVKLSADLYDECERKDIIKDARFSVLGSGVFAQDLPAFNGKIAALRDVELPKATYILGMPDS